jgi:hypothetical protein
MNKKISFLLIIFFIVSSTWISCSKKTTTDWKTFSHSLFSFQYPSEWIIEEKETNITIVGPQINGYFINMKVDYNDQIDFTVEEFMETVESQNQLELLPDFIDGGEKHIKIDDIEGLQRELQTSVTTEDTKQTLFVTLTYFVFQPSTGLVITTECPVESYISYKKTFETMLKSFSFGG